MNRNTFFKILFTSFVIWLALLLFNQSTAFAESKCFNQQCEPSNLCDPAVDICKDNTDGTKNSCQLTTIEISGKTESAYKCLPNTIQSIFGRILPPNPLNDMLKDDPTGAGAISKFLSNGINLIYLIAAIVLIFMIIWGAFQWLTSGGDKEQLASAQRRIIHAIIGILLLAGAFAIIKVLGIFTGFEFFKESSVSHVIVRERKDGKIVHFACTNKSGEYILSSGITDEEAEVRCNQ